MAMDQRPSPFPALAAQAVRGFCMGAADIVPGVSGGTIALIFGIYERLVDNIRIGASALGRLVRLPPNHRRAGNGHKKTTPEHHAGVRGSVAITPGTEAVHRTGNPVGRLFEHHFEERADAPTESVGPHETSSNPNFASRLVSKSKVRF